MSAPLGILVKSYAGDLAYADRLLASIERHNADRLPVFLVVPEADIDAFEAIARGARVMSELVFAEHLVDEPVNGISAGYMNQEIIKLCFWEAGLCENWLCMDSDAEFIRDFTAADFMATPETPFTFMSRDRELQAEPTYASRVWDGRAERLVAVADAVGWKGPWPLTVHGHAVMSAKAMRAFVEAFLRPRGWTYRDALATSPYEPSWYTAWVLASGIIDIVPREPVVKTFHGPDEHRSWVLTAEDHDPDYAAVVVNSNFSRGSGLVPLRLGAVAAIREYVSLPTALAALVSRRFTRR